MTTTKQQILDKFRKDYGPLPASYDRDHVYRAQSQNPIHPQRKDQPMNTQPEKYDLTDVVKILDKAIKSIEAIRDLGAKIVINEKPIEKPIRPGNIVVCETLDSAEEYLVLSVTPKSRENGHRITALEIDGVLPGYLTSFNIDSVKFVRHTTILERTHLLRVYGVSLV